MAPQDPQTAALLAHIVEQTERNVQFLLDQSYISHSDASVILSKLPNLSNGNGTPAADRQAGGIAALTSRMSNLMPTRKETPPNSGRSVLPPPPPVAMPQPTAPQPVRVRALWAYNGQDENDLNFGAGDIIEIVEENNADWWTGTCNGRTGIFPSNYVEVVPQTSAPVKPYKPFGAAHHGADLPPPSGQGTNSIGLQEASDNPEKKDKFGKYKSTLAHSAVGGVGFGAGSAIGSGLVRAIF